MMSSNPNAGVHRGNHPDAPGGSPIYVCDGAIARRCALVELFADGARISVGPASLPDKIVLVDPRTGFSHFATLVWRSEDEIGVRFLGAGQRYRVLRSAHDLAWNADRETCPRAS